MKRHEKQRGTERRIAFALRLLRAGFSLEEAARRAYISKERLQRALGTWHRKQLMKGDAMPQMARVRQLVEDIEAEAKGNNVPVRHTAALRWLQEGAEQNSFSAHEWSETLAALQQRSLSERDTPVRIVDTSEVATGASGKPAPKYLGEDGIGPYDRVAGTGPGFVGAGSSEPTNLGTSGVPYGSDEMNTLVADRMRDLSASGRPADRMAVIGELVNKGAVRSGYNPLVGAEQALTDALPAKYKQGA